MKMDSKGMESSKGMAMAMSEGEVKAIEKANNRITLKHGPIKSKTAEMTPMTMSFPVQESSLLTNVKVGDKVKFNVENIKGKATVTALQTQK
jgi:Cu/Ag efflux protein CusF